MRKLSCIMLVLIIIAGYALVAMGSDGEDSVSDAVSSISSGSSSKVSEEEANDKESALKAAKKAVGDDTSRLALIKRLTGKGYTEEAATYGADNCGADWNANAVNKAKQFLKSGSGYSYNSLVRQLKLEKFTEEEGNYAAKNCGADWNEQASKAVKNYNKWKNKTADEVYKEMASQGFTDSQIRYGMRANGFEV